MKMNKEYPHLELKTVNQMFIKVGIVYTRSWKIVKDRQVMTVHEADHVSAMAFKAEGARKSCLFVPNEEPPPVPHGGIRGMNNDTMTINSLRKRAWYYKDKE